MGAINSFRGMQTPSGANGFGSNVTQIKLPTMYKAGNGISLTEYPTGQSTYGQGQSLAASAGYIDRIKKFSNDSFGTNFNPSAAGQFDTTGMTADANGNYYANATDAAKMNASMGGMPGNGGMLDGITGSDIAQGVQSLAAGWNAYQGTKKQKLAEDMFGFQKAATNRTVANQANEYNTGIQNAGEVGMSLAGATMDANARAARQAQLDNQKISGAPIG